MPLPLRRCAVLPFTRALAAIDSTTASVESLREVGCSYPASTSMAGTLATTARARSRRSLDEVTRPARASPVPPFFSAGARVVGCGSARLPHHPHHTRVGPKLSRRQKAIRPGASGAVPIRSPAAVGASACRELQGARGPGGAGPPCLEERRRGSRSRDGAWPLCSNPPRRCRAASAPPNR